MQLKDILNITGTIELLSGLHIGAGKDAVEIGGLDQPIIKNPITNAPYIPGSSLKGKMRSLLEARRAGESQDTARAVASGKPCDCGKFGCPICMIFGVSGAVNTDERLGPTRILVRDSLLDEDCKEKFQNGELPMEIKYENTINRVKGTADNPRPLERVPAGVKFVLNIGFRVYKDDPEDLLTWLLRGLRLVELDALGGCGSRGCGEVRFCDVHIYDGQHVDKGHYDNLEDIKIF